MNYLRAVAKPTRKTTTDYQDKAITIAGKIACLDNKCRVCGRTGEIVPHHIVHRKYGNACALPENLWPVCVPCHSRIHHNEGGFKTWLETVSPGLCDRLWAIGREICRLDWEEVYSGLLERYHAMLLEREGNERP